MLEVGIELEHLRRRWALGWLQSLSIAVSGSGFGALLAGAHAWYVLLAFFFGGGAWVALLAAQRERRVHVAQVCARFLRYLDTYHPMGEHGYATNSEYVRAIVDDERKNRWERRRDNKAKRGSAT